LWDWSDRWVLTGFLGDRWINQQPEFAPEWSGNFSLTSSLQQIGKLVTLADEWTGLDVNGH
jgi:hypothetical protein